MSRPRTPSNVLELKGAFDKNPQRRREDPKVDLGLGEPPEYFEAEERAIWEEIAGQAPEGVLAKSDRLCIEMLVPMVLRLRRREPMKAAERAFMLSTLTRIGCTPADRSRVAKPAEPQEQLDIWGVLAASNDKGAA
ncbi:MAG: hypothetical protein ABL957_10675 [Parvularculaceae bacterium]